MPGEQRPFDSILSIILIGVLSMILITLTKTIVMAFLNPSADFRPVSYAFSRMRTFHR